MVEAKYVEQDDFQTLDHTAGTVHPGLPNFKKSMFCVMNACTTYFTHYVVFLEITGTLPFQLEAV